MTPDQCYEYFRKIKEKNPKKKTTRKKKPEIWNLFADEYQFMAVEGYYRSNHKAALRRRAVTLIDKYSQCGSSFDAFIPYLAVNYFDRFLSRHQDPPPVEGNAKKNLKLLAICCLLLAWKLRSKTFSVTEFLRSRALDGPNMSEKVMTMELEILDTLEWRMRSLTAIPFVDYFFPYFVVKDDVKRSQEFSRRRILQAVIQVQGVMKFTKFRPSTIAASVILCAGFKCYPSIFHSFVKRLFAFPYVDKDLSLWLCTIEMGIGKEAGILIKKAITIVQARQREAIAKAKIKEDAKKARAKAKADARAKARAEAQARMQAKFLGKKTEEVKAKGTKMGTAEEIKKETKTEEAKAKGTEMGTAEEIKKETKTEKAKAKEGTKIEEAKAKEGTKMEEAKTKPKEGTKMEEAEAKAKEGTKKEEAKETDKETKMEQAKEIKKETKMEQAKEIKKTVDYVRNKGKERIFELPTPKWPKSYGNIIKSQAGIIIRSEMREKMEKEKMMQSKPKVPTEVAIRTKEAEEAKGAKRAEEDVRKKAKGEEKMVGEPKPKVATEPMKTKQGEGAQGIKKAEEEEARKKAKGKEKMVEESKPKIATEKPIKTKQAEEAEGIKRAEEEEARRKAKGKEKMVEEPKPKIPKFAKSAQGPVRIGKGRPGYKPRPRPRIRPRPRGRPRIKVTKVKLETIEEEPSAEYFGEGEIIFLDFPLNWPRVELGNDGLIEEQQQLNIPNVGPHRRPQPQPQSQSQAQAEAQPRPQTRPQPKPCCGFM